MNELILHCTKVLELLDTEYPNQKSYSGIINKIYKLITEIYEHAKNGFISDEIINWSGLVRNFVDETTDYNSPILAEVEKIQKIIERGGLKYDE